MMGDKAWIEQANDFLREAGLYLELHPAANVWELMEALTFPRFNPDDLLKERWPMLTRDFGDLWTRAVQHAKDRGPDKPKFTVIAGGKGKA
jgi:8-oxo-dGTP pyrophosphatase MutT (NUDIX family)